VATEHNLYKTIRNIYVCIEFELLKVKVPSVFLGTVGFSLRRDGRYMTCISKVELALTSEVHRDISLQI
jgi:hypothetical protein